MTTTTKPRTEAVLRDGQPVYVGEGAVHQDGSLKLYRCTTCGDEVVWATSSRTGRRYLVNVSTAVSGSRFYVKRNAHRCDERQAERAKAAAVEQATSAYMAAFHDFQADRPNLTAEQIERAMDELDRLSDAVEAAKA